MLFKTFRCPCFACSMILYYLLVPAQPMVSKCLGVEVPDVPGACLPSLTSTYPLSMTPTFSRSIRMSEEPSGVSGGLFLPTAWAFLRCWTVKGDRLLIVTQALK
ncbi:hypothetical protein B0I35DRAFT_24967 [Stachybotrys elegans]|uniref:Secreted protein n=1 Tax=Stachybotrys elegans TaxID=80388 RepID=A0A8K0T209_9HYPO|nr:hypothetical protein B0I35DRAFT_24967 [Stachybotrys elegans]